MTELYDVAIVGFGPTGAVAAGLLGQAGRRVFVCDRTRSVYDKPRAIALDHEILRIFQQLGIAERIEPWLAPFRASEYYGVDGQLIKRIDMVPPPYPLGHTPTMVFTQPPVEAALREQVAALPSVAVALGREAIALEQAADRVSLRLVGDDGAEQRIEARYAVGCDGASSWMRQTLGLTLEDLDFDEPWLVVDVLVNEKGLATLPEVSVQYCEPQRPCTYVIGPRNHRRWEISLRPGEDPQAAATPEGTWRLLSRWITPEDATLWRQASYRFHALVAREWRRGRVFIAGDAAHQQPPFIGQGMCQGIRDAANLAWKLSAVLSDQASDALLDTYGAERALHVRQLTTRLKALGAVICEHDLAKARERDARLLAEAGGKVQTVARQDIVPPLATGLLSTAESSARGTLFPQPWIRRGEAAVRLDAIGGSGWRLVLDAAIAPATLDLPPEAVTRLGLQVLRIGAEPLVETEGVLRGWFDRHGCWAALVRPDHYVYAVAASEPDLDREVLALVARL